MALSFQQHLSPTFRCRWAIAAALGGIIAPVEPPTGAAAGCDMLPDQRELDAPVGYRSAMSFKPVYLASKGKSRQYLAMWINRQVRPA